MHFQVVVVTFFLAFFSDGFGVHADGGQDEVTTQKLRPGGLIRRTKRPKIPVTTVASFVEDVIFPLVEEPKEVVSEIVTESGVGIVLEDVVGKLRPGGLVRRTKPPVIAMPTKITTQTGVSETPEAGIVTTTAKLRPGGLVRRTKPSLIAHTTQKSTTAIAPDDQIVFVETTDKIIPLTTTIINVAGLGNVKKDVTNPLSEPDIFFETDEMQYANGSKFETIYLEGKKLTKVKLPFSLSEGEEEAALVFDLEKPTGNCMIVFPDTLLKKPIKQDIRYEVVSNEEGKEKVEFIIPERNGKKKTVIVAKRDDGVVATTLKEPIITSTLTTLLEKSTSDESGLDTNQDKLEELDNKTGMSKTTVYKDLLLMENAITTSTDLDKARHVGGVKFENVYVGGKKLTKVTLPFSLSEREGEETSLVFDLQVPIGNSTIPSLNDTYLKEKTVQYELISKEEGKEVVKFTIPGTGEKPDTVMVVQRYEEDESIFTCLKRNAKEFVSAIGVPAVIVVGTVAGLEFVVLLVSAMVLLHRKTGKMNFFVVTKLCRVVSVIFNQ